MNEFMIHKVIEKLPLSFFHHKLVILCGLSFMTDSMEVSLLSFLSNCAGDEFYLSNFARATLVGAVFIGELIGSLFWGPLADKFGRRFAFLVAICVISSFGLLSAFSISYTTLVASRTVVGFGVGGGSVPFDLLAEFLPGTCRGTYLLSIQYFWTFGTLFVLLIAYLTLGKSSGDDHNWLSGWRLLTFVTALPVVVASAVCYYYLPESPRWLLVKGFDEKAEKVVKEVARECQVDVDSLVYQSYSDDTKQQYNHSHSLLDIFRTWKSCRTTISIWLIWLIFGFTYYGFVLLVYRLFTVSNNHIESAAATAGKCGDVDYLSIVVNSASEVVGVFICTLTIDRWGRIPTQSVFFALSGCAVIAMSSSNMPLTALLIVSVIGRLSIMGACSAAWVVTPELYPTELRATSHSWCVSLSRLGGFLAPYFVISSISLSKVAIVLGGLNLVAMAATFMLPETAGASIDAGAHQLLDLDTSVTSTRQNDAGHTFFGLSQRPYQNQNQNSSNEESAIIDPLLCS